MLNDKKIVVAVTGSIAIYKTCELVRMYVKAGAIVRVVMSEAATKFITPLTFEALTRQTVLTQENESWSCDRNHIDFAKWADLIVVAPASANTINKISKGIADNLLTQILLASNAKKLIAPSANTAMLDNAHTVASIKMLKVNEYCVIEPQEKLLACGDVGKGAMAEVETIFDESIKALHTDTFYKDRKVIVTSGGSIEKIDDVRYISNFSSGKMGASIARWLYYKGADVFYLSFGKHDVPQGVYTLEVENSRQMKEYLIDAVRVAKKGKLSQVTMQSGPQTLIQKKPFLFMVAAVSDYVPAFPQEGKLKKRMLGASWNLELTQNEDILSCIDKTDIAVIGFKAETDINQASTNAKEMLHQKNLDGVCLNVLNSSKDFGTNDNEITFFTKDKTLEFGRDTKENLAYKLLESCKDL